MPIRYEVTPLHIAQIIASGKHKESARVLRQHIEQQAEVLSEPSSTFQTI